ncbi:MAG: DNA replication protein DnaC, partial [Oscillibacter sp.]|nr:DNA replication protein DnaC [Oscillibacter sp.]
MGYDGRVLRRARERFEADRTARREELDRRRDALYQLRPRLRDLDQALRATTGHVLAAAMRRGTDPLPELNRLRAENLRFQAEKKAILRELGQDPDCLDDIPACPLCGDTGWQDGRLCHGKNCLRSYYAQEQQKELSKMLDLGNQSFDTFSL